MEKKKLLYIVEAMGGGIYTYILELANELVNSFDVYIAYAVRPQTPRNFMQEFDERVHLIEVRNFTRSINPEKDLKALFEIKRIAKAIKPDIIHLHSSKAGALGRWAFNGRMVPLFYTPHGYSFLMADCNRWKRAVFRFIEAMSAKRNCTVISCSKGEHEQTLKLTGNALYVNNGINPKKLQGLLDGIPEETDHGFTVFTLGRLCFQKNPKLFNEVAQAMPDVRFLWIGDGELRDELKAPNIAIAGWVERAEAIRLARSADMFVMTSLWEGLPMSLLEAMYMKKPCAVSNVIGNRDVISDRKNGFVCNHVRDYVSAIEAVRQTGCPEFTQQAYEDCLSKYNISVMAQRYARIYTDALAGKGN